MSRIFNIDTKPYNYKLYYRKQLTINEGLTVLTGCNGAGKSTLLCLIEENLHRENIPVYSFDNYHDGGSTAASAALFYGHTSLAVNLTISSEGERIAKNFEQIAYNIGTFVRKNQAASELWILMDAVDSGYSIDNIGELKHNLFSVILEDCKSKDIAAYIVVSANSYEMANGEQCLDVWTGKYRTFKDYEDYKYYIKQTRKRKDRRYEKS